ncbi:MAG: IS200/IS605 family transposase [Bacteroidales bacterium]|nr:IS200/IS605 family transposase [Bacteroidales bacterium]
MSHTALTYHIVLGTYKRMRVIVTNEERFLYRFIYEFLTKRDVVVRRIGGMPDHVHILCDVPAKYALADLVRTLKSESSKYARCSQYLKFWEGWSVGYGAFTVGVGQREACCRYIMNQKSHHSSRSFEDEYRELLHDAGLSDNTTILGDEDPDC